MPEGELWPRTKEQDGISGHTLVAEENARSHQAFRVGGPERFAWRRPFPIQVVLGHVGDSGAIKATGFRHDVPRPPAPQGVSGARRCPEVATSEGVGECGEFLRQLGVSRCFGALLGDDRATHDDTGTLDGH